MFERCWIQAFAVDLIIYPTQVHESRVLIKNVLLKLLGRLDM